MKFIYKTRWGNTVDFIKAYDYDNALQLAQRYRFGEIVDIEALPLTRENFTTTDILPTQQLSYAHNLMLKGVALEEDCIEHLVASLTRLIYYVSNLSEPLDNDILQGLQIYRNFIPDDSEFPRFFEWVALMEDCVIERFITRSEYLGVEPEDYFDEEMVD